jgi:hypothetical protein
MLKLKMCSSPLAAWFDLTGGLTDKIIDRLERVVKQYFHGGSLLFITLAIDGNIRGLSKDHQTSKHYSTFNKERINRAISTALLLEGIVRDIGAGKWIQPVMLPYVYKRSKTTYGLFGYIVGETN